MQARSGSRLAARRVRVLLAALAMALTFVAGIGPAGAHAVVTSSSPSDGEQLKTPPSEVTVTFSESVSSDLGGLKVLDAAGNRVDRNDSSQPTPTSLRTTLNPGLGDGTYVANYKIVSADGHAISGAIVFGVGNAKISDVSGLAAKNDPTAEVLSRIGQFLTYLGALLAAGLAFFLAFIHDGAPDRERLASRTRWATILAAVGVAVTILAQAALATGGGLGAAFQSGTIGPVLRQGLGWSAAVLLVGLAAVHLSVDMRKRVVGQSLAFYGGLAVTSSFVLWGHATEADRSWLAIPADVVHVACAATWFGGLVGLFFVLRARRPAAALLAAGGSAPASADLLTTEPTAAVDVSAGHGGAQPAGADGGGVALLEREGGDEPATGDDQRPHGGDDHSRGGDHHSRRGDHHSRRGDHAPVPGSFPATVHTVLRFSTMAAVSVILLVIAGTVLGYAELGSFSALLTTTYGLTLTVKVALVAVVLFMAGYNRYFLLPWLLPADDGAGESDGHTDDDAPAAIAPADTTGATATDTTPADDGASDIEGTPGSEDAEAAHLADGWRTLVRTLLIEALGVVAILAVTAVLVNVTPGVSTEVKGPFQASQPFRDGKVAITVAPNQPGVNNIHLDFTGPDGRASDAAQKVTLELTLPAKDIGPITREFVKAGTGHFILEDINDLSIAGDWQITLLVRVSDFDQERVSFQDTVT